MPYRHPARHLQVHAQLHGHPQKVAISVYPDASIYEQLQLELQHAGLVPSAQFGGELIQRGDCFRDWGMEGGASITVIVESIDRLTGEDYAAMEPAMQETLEGVLEWYAMQARQAGASMRNAAMDDMLERDLERVKAGQQPPPSLLSLPSPPSLLPLPPRPSQESSYEGMIRI